MKKCLLSVFCLFTVLLAFGQEDEYESMPYIHGDILVMIDHNDNIQTVVENHRNIDGVMTGLQVAEVVSAPANIWLLHFNHNHISHLKMLAELYTDPHVVIAQNNHLVTSDRVVPNDPNYGAQWQHQNIDSEQAWDITTGGLTANGDEIVVAVLEGGGADWDHPDLLANHWINTYETDGNGIDDDGNGYIDDYHGWNPAAGTDFIAAGGHGTSVSGMIGAVGNNGSVVVGANWNVKIMQVDMPNSGLSEANVINSYTYPLVLRQQYNNTNGALGAFVVATNASWGIDGGDPASAPLWCAFYDTLGAYGILNFGATANNPDDIDVVGDLPTACGSDYMVAIGASQSNDTKATFSGYGQTTIDLMSPGASIVTTVNGGGSGSTSGTSFATPLTAGVCALMYSVPCSNLADMAMADPQAAADIVRQAILDGCDPIPAMATQCVTGGRLNAYNSCQIIVTDCPSYNTNCTGTFAGTPTAVLGCSGDCNGQVTMSGSGGSGTYNWSIDGGATWTTNPTFSNLCAGNHTVMLDDGADCQQNIPINITEPDPVSGSASVTHISCNGANDGEVTVTGAGGTPPYQYSNDGGSTFQGSSTFTGVSSGVNTFVIEDSEGCQTTVNVGVNEPSALSLSSTTTDEIAGNDGAINLTVSGGTPPYSYAWTGPNGFTSTVADPSGLESGTYSVTVTDANGCVVTSGSIDVGSQLSIGENEFEFSVYPNPASDEITINLPEMAGVRLMIIDNTGKLVVDMKLINKSTVVDVSKLATGVYTLKLTSDEGQVSANKLVIE